MAAPRSRTHPKILAKVEPPAAAAGAGAPSGGGSAAPTEVGGVASAGSAEAGALRARSLMAVARRSEPSLIAARGRGRRREHDLVLSGAACHATNGRWPVYGRVLVPKAPACCEVRAAYRNGRAHPRMCAAAAAAPAGVWAPPRRAPPRQLLHEARMRSWAAPCCLHQRGPRCRGAPLHRRRSVRMRRGGRASGTPARQDPRRPRLLAQCALS